MVATSTHANAEPSNSPSPSPSPTFSYYARSNIPAPIIDGDPTYGNTLTAITGGWPATAMPENFRYQWYRNGSPIVDATTKTYRLRLADIDQKISLDYIGLYCVPGLANKCSDFYSESNPVTVLSGVNVTITPSPTPSFSYGMHNIPTPIIYGEPLMTSELTALAGDWGTDAYGVKKYQWNRNGNPIPTATFGSYIVGIDDLEQSISVSVTGTKCPANICGQSTTVTSSALLIEPGVDFTQTPKPSIYGMSDIGSPLMVIPGAWDPAATLSYQWLRDGAAIDGANRSMYTTQPADGNHAISVSVTGQALGYFPATQTSNAFNVNALKVMTQTPSPTISGTPTIGSTLSAVAGQWDQLVILNYQWKRNGTAIDNAIYDSYTLTPSDAGKQITVTVTGTRPTYLATSQTSTAVTVPLGDLTSTPAPSISGTPTISNTLTATTNGWDDGVTFTYQWNRDGVAIPAATSSTYVLQSADVTAQLTVTVTGSLNGYKSATATSPSVKIKSGVDMSNVTKPTITGSATFGSTVSAQVDSWEDGATYTYQWSRDNIPLANQTSSSYTIRIADLNHSLTVSATGKLTGFNTVTKASNPVTPTKRNFPLTPTPTISGTPKNENTLTAIPGNWNSGVVLSYQWTRNSTPIPNATKSSYVVHSADVGNSIQVKVTGNRSGYNTATTISDGVTVQLGDFTFAASITGAPQVGATLGFNATQLTAPAIYIFSEQAYFVWKRDGVAIPNATQNTYRLVPADLGHSITLSVTLHLEGYNDFTQSSSAVSVTPGVLALTPKPTISGTVKSGSKLTAVTGTWDAGVKFTYQWTRGGVAIAGATSSGYVLTKSDVNTKIAVSVTGSLLGYSKVTVSSAIVKPLTFQAIPRKLNLKAFRTF